MSDYEAGSTSPSFAPSAQQTRIPIVEEEARVIKRATDTERVTVHTIPEEEHVVLRDRVMREHVDVVRVPINREVAEAPPTRTEGDVTIVPVVEERLVVEKRLVLVEELHLRRSARTQDVEITTTVRRMRVEIEHSDLNPEENH